MKRLLLAGAGHAHLHVLKSMAVQRWRDVEVVLVSPCTRQIYSGMVPGWIAGHYTLDQCAAELLPLVQRAGVRFIETSVTALDASRRVATRYRRRNQLTCSRSTPARLSTAYWPAVVRHAAADSPAGKFRCRLGDNWPRSSSKSTANLVVVGGGAAGVELALAVRYRLARNLAAAGERPSGGRRRPAQRPQPRRHPPRRTLNKPAFAFIEGLASGTATGIQLDNGAELRPMRHAPRRPGSWLANSG